MRIGKIKALLERLSVFDWLIIFVVMTGVIFLVTFIFKEEKWVKVEVNITPGEWWWDSRNLPYWLANSIVKGDEQFDTLGRKTVEVLDVRSYEQAAERQTTYVTLNLRVEVDKRTRKLKFDHRPLEVGKSIDLGFGKIGTPGVVTFIEGMADNRIKEEKIVEARAIEWSSKFPDTLGIFPWRVEAIRVGDQMRDSQGQVVAEILDKKVEQAERIVVTDDGKVVVRRDPLKQDVVLKIKLWTIKQEGINYFLNRFKVKVGYGIPVSLPLIDLGPEITRIIQ